MKNILNIIIFIFISANLFAGEYIVKDINNDKKTTSWIILPYAFKTESMGFTLGAFGIWSGYIQPQMNIFATVYRGEELEVQKENNDNEKANTKGMVLGIANYRLPFFDRTFVTFLGSYAYYPNQFIYIDGSNNSNPDDVLKTQGYNNWFYFDFRTILPMGETKDNPIITYKQKNGFVVNRDNYGGGLPFITGKSVVGIMPFYQKTSMDKYNEEPVWATNGLKVYLEHENTDYEANPSVGYRFKLQLSNDFDFFNSSQSWNSLDFSYSHFLATSHPKFLKHSAIALNLWTAYSPSWEKDETKIFKQHRPPPWEGARLGGWNRLRGYDSNRFNDKAAFYLGGEYRIIPNWNPLKGAKWNPFPIDWFQLVAFVEAGRVASTYNVDKFTDNIKTSAGFSIRALAAKVPIRFDVGFGKEETNMWVMIKQPF